MGCDIHAFLESKRKGSEYWYGLGGEIHLGRHYWIFGRLAGVRSDGCLFDPRGVPKEMSRNASDKYWLKVNDKYQEDEEYCSQEQALRWIKSGCLVKLNQDNTIDRVQHPDWHSASWLNAEEFEKCLDVPDGWSDIEDYQAVLAAMKSFESNGFDARLIFWFDN